MLALFAELLTNVRTISCFFALASVISTLYQVSCPATILIPFCQSNAIALAQVAPAGCSVTVTPNVISWFVVTLTYTVSMLASRPLSISCARTFSILAPAATVVVLVVLAKESGHSTLSSPWIVAVAVPLLVTANV